MQALNIKEQSQQEALWELVKTEVDYISAVTVILDVKKIMQFAQLSLKFLHLDQGNQN